jgi:uncharacterized protein
MARERVVLDTNVLISRLISAKSTPSRAVEHALLKSDVLVSEQTIAELAAKLASPKFDPYLPRDLRLEFIARYRVVAELIPVNERIRVCRDPRDDMFLEVAVCGNANLIVTGDADLLQLSPFRGIEILSASDYLLRP